MQDDKEKPHFSLENSSRRSPKFTLDYRTTVGAAGGKNEKGKKEEKVEPRLTLPEKLLEKMMKLNEGST